MQWLPVKNHPTRLPNGKEQIEEEQIEEEKIEDPSQK